MVWGCFSGVEFGPLGPVKGTPNASAYQDILDNVMLPTLWEQFMVPFGWCHFGDFGCSCLSRNPASFLLVITHYLPL